MLASSSDRREVPHLGRVLLLLATAQRPLQAGAFLPNNPFGAFRPGGLPLLRAEPDPRETARDTGANEQYLGPAAGDHSSGLRPGVPPEGLLERGQSGQDPADSAAEIGASGRGGHREQAEDGRVRGEGS